MAKAEQRSPLAPAPLQDLQCYYGLLRPCSACRYSRPRDWRRLWLVPSRRPLKASGVTQVQVLTFHTKAWSSFAPPTCRMPLGPSQASPELIPEEGSPPGFDITSSAFDTSSTVCFRSPLSTLPAGIIVPAFPQRSPPRYLTAAACGGLRSAPDCRTRRALLHLSYSCASPVLMAMLVTHDPSQTFRRHRAHAVAIASHPHTLRAGGDELQMTLDEIIDQSASSLGVQAASSCPATQEVSCIRPAGRTAPWRPAGPACRSLR